MGPCPPDANGHSITCPCEDDVSVCTGSVNCVLRPWPGCGGSSGGGYPCYLLPVVHCVNGAATSSGACSCGVGREAMGGTYGRPAS